MPGLSSAKALLFLVLSLIILTYVGITQRDFYTRGEGREALVAQSMLQSGNWILPVSYNNTIPSKPPFMHWFIAGISSINGEVNEVTSRLPSAAFFIAAVIVFYLFLKNRYGKQIAFYAALILSTCAEWYRYGMECRVDMLFSALLFMGFLSFFKWHEGGEKGPPLSAAFLLLGAVLSKGPAAIVLSGIIFFSYYAIKRQSLWRSGLKLSVFFVPVIVLSLLWYVEAYQTGGERFVQKVYNENVARFLSTMDDEPHHHSVLYLLGTIPIGLLPWSLVLIPALVLRVGRSMPHSEASKSDDFRLFSKIVIFVFIIFFSIPASKRSVYLLPIYPFLSFFAAEFLARLEEAKDRFISIAGKISQLTVSALLLLLLLIYLQYERLSSLKIFSKPRYLFYLQEINAALNSLNHVDEMLLVCLVLYCLYLLLKRSFSFLNIGVLFLLLICTLQYIFITHYAVAISPRRFARSALAKVPKTVQIYTYVNDFYALSFYNKRRFLRTENYPLEPGSVVVIFKTDLESLRREYSGHFEVIAESENYVEKPLKKLLAVKFQPALER